jgi:hypothetical protein
VPGEEPLPTVAEPRARFRLSCGTATSLGSRRLPRVTQCAPSFFVVRKSSRTPIGQMTGRGRSLPGSRLLRKVQVYTTIFRTNMRLKLGTIKSGSPPGRLSAVLAHQPTAARVVLSESLRLCGLGRRSERGDGAKSALREIFSFPTATSLPHPSLRASGGSASIRTTYPRFFADQPAPRHRSVYRDVGSAEDLPR